MLLRLTPDEALGRAAFALASVAVAFVGHAALGHGHCDVTQLVLAGFLLLFASWRTRNVPRLFGASIGAQFVVHGGIPTETHMIAIHAAASVVALGLMQHSEQLWHALARVLLPTVPTAGAAPQWRPRALVPVWHNVFTSTIDHLTHPDRGPPALAL